MKETSHHRPARLVWIVDTADSMCLFPTKPEAEAYQATLEPGSSLWAEPSIY